MSAERIGLPEPLRDPGALRILDLLGRGGAEARFVGGCVRDALLGRPVRDIDVATGAVPGRVMELLAADGVKVVPTGIDHGTVTAVIDGRGYEITTLRRDLETDGRRAVVGFTADWREDAARRDFTMNALSLSSDGMLHDHFGGAEDARAGRVRFVGEPERRIREDVLRILRFFRFLAHYGRGGPDQAALDACARLAHLLPGLSAERVRAEVLRLLEAPDPATVWALMAAIGVLAHLLPEAAGFERLIALQALEAERGIPADPLRRLAALLPDGTATASSVAERLRLSGRERDRLLQLAGHVAAIAPGCGRGEMRRLLRRLGAGPFADLALLAAAGARVEGEPPQAERNFLDLALAEAGAWRPVSLPVAGRDLAARGVPPGPGMGELLRALDAWWEERDYRPDRAACLAELDRLLVDKAPQDRSGGI